MATQVEIPTATLQHLDADGDNNPENWSLELLARCRSEVDALQTKTAGMAILQKGVANWRSKEADSDKTEQPSADGKPEG